eukprot:tig00001532_g9277.t1
MFAAPLYPAAALRGDAPVAQRRAFLGAEVCQRAERPRVRRPASRSSRTVAKASFGRAEQGADRGSPEPRMKVFAAALARAWANRSAWLAAGAAAASIFLVNPNANAYPGLNESLQQQAARNQMAEEQEIFNEAWAVVNQTYVDTEKLEELDWHAVFAEVLEGKSPGNREETYGAIRRMLERLGDPYTRFLDPKQFSSFEISTSGDLSGVGLQFSLNEGGEVEVIAPLEGGPAEKAGIEPGDVIVAIDGEATEGMGVDDIATRIRGPKGTPVTLTVARPGAAPEERQRDYRLVRDKVQVTPVFAQLYEVPEDEAAILAAREGRPEPPGPTDKIGYIFLREFSMNAGREVARAVDRLDAQGAQGYVLDLRNNPGGVLDAGLDIARLWLEPGSPVVYTINREKEEVTYTSGPGGAAVDTDGRLRGEGGGSRLAHPVVRKPLVVLVNRGSASASEIVASALQENCRAVLVGSRTYGKGLVQAVFRLFDGSAMTVTVARYETAARHDIHKVGVQPDLPFPRPPSSPSSASASSGEADTTLAARFRRLLDGKKVERLEEEAGEGGRGAGEAPLDPRTAIALVNPLKLAPRLDECERPDGQRGPARPLELPAPAPAPIAAR